jgi:putative selenate reductase
MTQYFDEIRESFKNFNANKIDEYINRKGKKLEVREAGLINLNIYAEEVLENKAYYKNSFPHNNIKTSRVLTKYDCVHAPCTETCAVSQDVSEYMRHTANGDFGNALNVILKDNPLPNITGNVCDHLCETKCTRMNYDNTLLIRGIKRFNSENDIVELSSAIKPNNGLSVAIIGAGPSGLSSAYFLALEGFNVNLYEAKSFAGGMASDSIPFFRLTDEQIKKDVDLIKSLGVTFHFNKKVDSNLFNELKTENDFIHIAVGAKNSKALGIKGENNDKVINQLLFLSKVRRNEKIELGKSVAIIGGGNSAIDAARTANRLVGIDGKVTVVYRRTKNEMPADKEEVTALLSEGIELLELTAPQSIELSDEVLKFNLTKMELGKPDSSGRKRPIEIPNSQFTLMFDSIIPAIGQEVELDFIEGSKLSLNNETLESQFSNIFAGGDAIRGADSLINAIGDGKKIAEQIINRANITSTNTKKSEREIDLSEFQHKQATRIFGKPMPEISLEKRDNFELVHPSLNPEEAIAEATRCLQCDDVCNICIGVCPNFANISFQTESENIPIYKIENRNGEFNPFVDDKFIVEPNPQIFNIGDFCNECGNCNTFCPTNDAPYLTKPKFYLTSNSFNSEDNCYLFENDVLHFRLNDSVETITQDDKYYIYDSTIISLNINKQNYSIENFVIHNTELNEIELSKLSEMIFLFKYLKNNSVLIN